MMTNKVRLQELFPDEELKTMRECLDELEWSYDDTKEGAMNIKCCEQLVYIGGWVGAEHAHCKVCDKGMQDVTGILPAGNSTAVHIDYDKTEMPEDGRVWITRRFW